MRALAYHPFMTWDAVWDVLKWILLVLAAGFVGQFGKTLALRIIERRKRAKREAEPSQELGRETSSPHPEIAHIEAQAKIEKKRAKAEVKRLKKLDD